VNELSKTLQKRAHSEVARDEDDEASLGSLEGIKAKIEQLLEHKKALESYQEAGETRLMLEFLVRLREAKEKEARETQQVLLRIERDIGKANELLGAFQREEAEEKRGDGSGEDEVDGDPMPSAPQEDNPVSPSVLVPSEEEESAPQPKRLMSFLSKAVAKIAGQSPPTAVHTPSAPVFPSAALAARSAKLKKMADFFADLDSAYCQSSQDEEHFAGFKDTLNTVVGVSKMRELASIRVAERCPSTNIISSVEFNADATVFAAGGVSKKIRVFNYETILRTPSEHAFPLLSIPTEAKISNICWNPYITGQLGSVDYDGVVNVFDAASSHHVQKFEEHEKRAWSLDFSVADPTRLVSGSDDNKVKVWSMNMNRSVCTIDARSNVCSVRYSPVSSHILAFGAADHNVHVYDLRNPTRSLYTLSGHSKAVSYVKWASPSEIISASTDHSLKHWKIPGLADGGATSGDTAPGAPSCTRSYTGHANERNFVGLDLDGDFIACGSETNTVHVYHRALRGPLASYKFSGLCPITGRALHTQHPQFISSVAWKPGAQQLLAANSDGMIKVLELA
jgi:WD40 repeat protein